MSFYADLSRAATKRGLNVHGAVDFKLAEQDFQQHRARYDEWIGRGYGGAMEYLVRGQMRRADPSQLLPGAKSIFCTAFPYSARPLGGTNGPKFARYLRGADYHKDIKFALEDLMKDVSLAWPDLEWKICVDTSAVLERSWAALAGLGWIGKNSLLIHPQLGSYFFLGEVLLNRETKRAPQLQKNYCGPCRRCLEACPTEAFTSAGMLDSNKCISYWTLEKRGELNISVQQKQNVGTWIAGCDVCQEVCPFNTKAAKRSAGQKDDEIYQKSWQELREMSPEEYELAVRASALRRVKPNQFERNLAIAYANRKP